MLAAGTTSGIYKFVLVLHIVAVVVGFGAVVLNGVYAAEGKKRPGPGGRAVAEANFAVTMLGEKFIYAVPVLGITLVLLSDKAWKFSQTWVWLALTIYILAIAASHAVLIPGAKKIQGLLLQIEEAPGPEKPAIGEQIAALGKKQAATGASLNLALLAIIVLMVWKPGS